jgi:hypothetical protein
VGNFGRLARFAANQWNDILVGAHAPALNEKLRPEAQTLADLTHQFAREVGRLLRTHREGILDMQLIQERVAWAAVDLYVSAAVLSKLQSVLDGGNGNGSMHRDLLIGKRFCHHAAERIASRLHGLAENHDAEILALADAVIGPQP